MGVLAALWEARGTGRGQVVDAAIVDGVSHLMAGIWSFFNAGLWQDQRGVNLLDGGAPFYSVYETADGRHLAIGPIEPQFWDDMIRLVGIDEPAHRFEPARWPAVRTALEHAFRTRTQAEWISVFEGSDACVTPVASMTEASQHPHLAARGTLRVVDGRVEPAAAPRFSGHPAPKGEGPWVSGTHTSEVLAEVGFDLSELLASGAAFQA